MGRVKCTVGVKLYKVHIASYHQWGRGWTDEEKLERYIYADIPGILRYGKRPWQIMGKSVLELFPKIYTIWARSYIDAAH